MFCQNSNNVPCPEALEIIKILTKCKWNYFPNFTDVTIWLTIPMAYTSISKIKKNSNIYFPLAEFTAQSLVGLCKQLKQIIQIEHNVVENPYWLEANELAIYKWSWGFQVGAIVKQIYAAVRVELEPGPLDWKSDVLTTQWCCISQTCK